jgi:UPF0716 protein FxsA
MAWAFLIGALTLPVAEVMVWIRMADAIGGLATVGLTVLAILAGSALMRRGGLGMALDVRARMERGEPPGPAVFEGACITLAGLLLMVPGFITDGIALLLLLPPLRAWLLKLLLARMVLGGAPFAGSAQAPGGDPRVIDGEYEIISPDSTPAPDAGGKDEHKRLEH